MPVPNPPATGGTFSRQRVDERMRQFEEQHDLLQYQLEGWSVWTFLRFQVYYALLELPVNVHAQDPGLSRTRRLSYALRDLVRLLFLRPARYAVLVQSSNRSEREAGRYKDVYFDDLLAGLGSFVKLENLLQPGYIPRNQMAAIPSRLTLSLPNVLLGLLMKLPGPPTIDAMATTISALLSQELDVTAFPPQRLAQLMRNFYWSKRIYTWLLRRIGPQYLLLVTAYSYYAIVAAAKELGINVVEFQHGLIDRYHNAYSWPRSARRYKPHMPIPDRLFLYGEHWQKELQANGFWDQELRPVGSLRIDQYRQARSDQALPAGPYSLLVTTQNLDTARLTGFLAEFLKLAAGRVQLHLVIKLHPGENSTAEYEAAFGPDERVTVLLNSEGPSTFELLTTAHLHLSIYSTCHYEALGLGVPTAILPLSNHETVLHLLETGYAFLARTPQALLDYLLELPRQEPPPTVGAAYFTPGAVENMQRELQKDTKA